jgi:hypothetical protein
MNVCIWSGFPTSDIGYPIRSDRRTMSDKLNITQLLPTEYSINITNRFGGYQYNKQWMYVYGVDIRPNIHLTYTGIRRISDWIFIWCMLGSGGLLTEYSFGVCRGPADYSLNIHSVYTGFRRITYWIFSWCMQGSGGLLTEYSFGVWRGPVDFRLNIQLVCAGFRRITYWIFSWCMQGSGGLLTEYSFGVCMGPVDFRLNIQLVCAGIRRIFQLNIHSVYEWVRWIANWIFSWCVQGSGGLLIRYSFGACTSRLPIGHSLIALELNI